MKKETKKQYTPFDDFNKVSYPTHDKFGEERPWEDVVNEMRNRPTEQRSNILSHLVKIYRDEIKNNNEVMALEKFWNEVEELHRMGRLTDEMKEVLLEAKEGSINAAPVMVRACPEIIQLPFVGKIMSYIISQHKYMDPGKESGHLENAKNSWLEFLPKRSGGSNTYNDKDIINVLRLAKKQLKNRGQKNPKRGEDYVSLVADALCIKPDTLKKIRASQKML